MRIIITKYAIPFCLAIAIVVVLLSVGQRLQFQKLKQAAAESAQRGGTWLLAFKGPLEDPGILWGMHIINQRYCHSEKLSQIIALKFREFEYHPTLSLFRRLLETPGKESPLRQKTLPVMTSIDRWVLPPLYCREVAVDQDLQDTLLNTADLHGYELTHAYLGLLFLDRYGCSNDKIIHALNTVPQQLVEEQDTDTFSDVFAERIAFLGYAKQKNLIGKEWIHTILTAQQDSGAWNDPIYGPKDNPHTTALAIWALAEFSESCPFSAITAQ